MAYFWIFTFLGNAKAISIGEVLGVRLVLMFYGIGQNWLVTLSEVLFYFTKQKDNYRTKLICLIVLYEEDYKKQYIYLYQLFYLCVQIQCQRATLPLIDCSHFKQNNNNLHCSIKPQLKVIKHITDP